MKKLAAIFAAAVMVFTIGACSVNRNENQAADKQAFVQNVWQCFPHCTARAVFYIHRERRIEKCAALVCLKEIFSPAEQGKNTVCAVFFRSPPAKRGREHYYKAPFMCSNSLLFLPRNWIIAHKVCSKSDEFGQNSLLFYCNRYCRKNLLTKALFL